MTVTGNTTSGSAVVTGISPNTTGMSVGMLVTAGTSLLPNYTATIASINSSTQITLSASATSSVTGDTFVVGANLISAGSTHFGGSSSLKNYGGLSSHGTVTFSAGSSGTHINVYKPVSATGTLNFSGSANLIQKQNLSATGSVNFSGTAALTFDGQGLTVYDVINDILLQWGIEQPQGPLQASIQAFALACLNAAIQQIWSSAKARDYFTRQTLEITIPAGQNSVSLNSLGVQNILGPIRRTADLGNVRPLSSRSQFDQFSNMFLGNYSLPSTTPLPLAYFLDRLYQSDDDSAGITLNVTPTPQINTSLTFDVALDAPRYIWNDYVYRTRLQIPHKYAETLLMPICRFKSMASYLFIFEECRPQIVADYNAALQFLGIFDPQVKEVDEADRQTLPSNTGAAA